MMPDGGAAQEDADVATPASGQAHDMVLTRRFDAPVARVWRAWTNADDVRRWWGPEGFTAPVAEMEVRVGGTSLVCMRSPQGQDSYNTWTYEEIVPQERLVFVQRFADQDGDRISPADAGLPPEIPAEVRHVLTFEALPEDQTELTVTEEGYSVEWIVEVSRQGMEQCLDKMAAIFSAESAKATPSD